MPRVIHVGFQRIKRRIKAIDRELNALPWYALWRRSKLRDRRAHFEVLQSRLRSELYDVHQMRDEYDRALWEEYNPTNEFHNAVLRNITT